MTKTDAEIHARAAQIAAHVQDYMEREGRSEISMTDATEAIWGTSGRGNPKAVRVIEAAAYFGWLSIRQIGARRRVVSRTDRPLPQPAVENAA